MTPGKTVQALVLALGVAATAAAQPAIEVIGLDGKTVVYAIAELDAAFTDRIVLLADRRNGQPLLPDTGPWQVIVPNDKRPARWVRQVNKLEVRQLP